MQIKTFMAHGDMEKLEADINAFLATAGSPLFTELAIDERRVFVMMGFDSPPAAAENPPSVEPVGDGDPAAAPPPADAPPPSDAPAPTPSARSHKGK